MVSAVWYLVFGIRIVWYLFRPLEEPGKQIDLLPKIRCDYIKIIVFSYFKSVPWGSKKTFTVVWSAISALSRSLELFVGYGVLLICRNLRFKQIFKILSFG